MNDFLPYFTIVIPYVPPAFQTEWHPDCPTGPFSTLTRGNFKTVEEAINWGAAKLRGTPYSIREITE